MVFAYYNRLSPRQKRTYDASDEVRAIRLYRPAELTPLVGALEAALGKGARRRLQSACSRLTLAMTRRLGVTPVKVRVLESRPHDETVELHGLYLPAIGRRWATVTVWMRTAKRMQTVAFRTFLRTLLHEVCHHLDYQLLGLEESYHTEGFYRRETSLFHQLVPSGAKRSKRAREG